MYKRNSKIGGTYGILNFLEKEDGHEGRSLNVKI